MNAPTLAEIIEEGKRLSEAANLPPVKWEGIEKGRIYLAHGGLIATVREQIPDDVDPDGDDPEAWEIGDAAVEEAARRAELVAFLVNNGPRLLAVAEDAARFCDPAEEWLKLLDDPDKVSGALWTRMNEAREKLLAHFNAPPQEPKP